MTYCTKFQRSDSKTLGLFYLGLVCLKLDCVGIYCLKSIIVETSGLFTFKFEKILCFSCIKQPCCEHYFKSNLLPPPLSPAWQRARSAFLS